MVALLLVAALGCATTRTPPRVRPATNLRPPPTGSARELDDILRRDLTEDDAFPWSAARPLTWEDFQGHPPTAGPEGAKTSYVLYSVWNCSDREFHFRVIVAFRPRESWVKPVVLGDSVQRRTLLDHEQTHFDLAEVHAQRMQQVFGDLVDACRKTDAELGAVVDRLAREEKEEQSRYDSETTHGILSDRQAAWTLETRRRLAAR